MIGLFFLRMAITAGTSLLVSGRGEHLSGPQTGRDDSIYVGDWRGESTCVVRESACHDEDSLYHISKMSGPPGHFSVKLDKIVHGETITMGTMECAAQPAEYVISCPLKNAVMEFAVSAGSKMNGTMKLSDGTVWRKLTLYKQ